MASTFVRALALALAAGALACAAPVEPETGDGAQAQSASTPAATGFMCDCIAKGPGVENLQGIKECAYLCDCDTFHPDKMRSAGRVEVGPMESRAFSWERWDSGSRICHGQYAYKATLDSPNWQIEVKFSRFKLTHLGYVAYAEAGDGASTEQTVTERVRSSSTIIEQIRRTAQAPEVRDALAKKLGVKGETP